MKAQNIVFCVGNTPEKDAAFLDFAKAAGIPVRKLRGAYKGVEETSFEVPAEFAADIMPLVANEESILLLDGDLEDRPQAALFYPSTFDEEPLGTLAEIPAAEADKLDAWTLDLSTGRYYATH